MGSDALFVAAAVATIAALVLTVWQMRRSSERSHRAQASAVDVTRTQKLDRATGWLVDVATITNRSPARITNVSYQVAVPLHTYRVTDFEQLGGQYGFGSLAPGEQAAVRIEYDDPRGPGRSKLPPGHLFFKDADGYEWVRQPEGPLSRPPSVKHRRRLGTHNPNKELPRKRARIQRRNEWLRRKAKLE